ncbi:MAG: GH25 family lysozyme [Candidatus Paceibacterota bacterium]|jgi:GH25 family lysozyme M1 (1,4-beta-N-acetylmuramidase)
MTFEVNGYDVSKHQGEINWPVFSTFGDFYIIRAGSIDNVTGQCYEDYQFKNNTQRGLPYGKPMGTYWYFRPQFSGILQADFYCKLIEKYIFKPGFNYGFKIEPSCDAEEDAELSANQVLSSIWVFNNRINVNLGVINMIYTSPGFWDDAHVTTWAHEHPLWNAQWPGTNAQKPVIPKDWSKHKKQARFWQWKVGNNGQELGFGIGSKGVCMDRFMGTRAEFDALYGTSPIPDPTPDPIDPPSVEHRLTVLEREVVKLGGDLTPE